jgi:hypothetical protein
MPEFPTIKITITHPQDSQKLIELSYPMPAIAKETNSNLNEINPEKYWLTALTSLCLAASATVIGVSLYRGNLSEYHLLIPSVVAAIICILAYVFLSLFQQRKEYSILELQSQLIQSGIKEATSIANAQIISSHVSSATKTQEQQPLNIFIS